MENKNQETTQLSLQSEDSKPGKITRKNSEVEAVQVNPTPEGWISQALNLGYSPEDVRQFLDMRDRDIREKQRLAFKAAFTAFQEEVPELIKNKAGDRGRYKYIELPELQKHLRKPLAKHGFSISWDQDDTGETVIVICTLSHISGYEQTSRLSGKPGDVVSNNESATNGIQKKAALITYLRRYTYTAVLGISSGDQDTDGRVQQQTGKRTASDTEFKEVLRKIATKQMTRDDAEKLFNFSGGQMNALESVK